jgi:L-ascorbate metabolism protein UlaG (beta-lactamase superfamily)
MKKRFCILLALCLTALLAACTGTPDAAQTGTIAETDNTTTINEQGEETMTESNQNAKLLYMGHASIRITTPEGKVVYVDPYAGDGYGPAADLILVTHSHFDHTALDKIANRAPDCRTITWKEALKGGRHQTFDLGYASVEAVEAGYNRNHSVKECVGYVLTLSDGVRVYVSGDTSETKQMPLLAQQNIDYAFFCCDGVYNMDLSEAAECAALVGAKHNIPYHVIPAGGGTFFDRARAEQFNAEKRLILDAGEEIALVHE